MNEFSAGALNFFEQGYLMGLHLGDGYLNYNLRDRHYNVEFYLNYEKDGDIRAYLGKLLTQTGVHLTERKDKRSNTLRVRVSSKAFFNYIQNKTQQIELLHTTNLDYLWGFLGGFIDAEGYVGKGEIVLTQKDKAILDKISQICQILGVIIKKIWYFRNYKTTDKVWRLRISPKSRETGLKSLKLMRKYGGACGPP